MKSIAIITARSGSKGLIDKNIKDLCGKPLLVYSIEAAIKSKKFDKVFVSTDSEKYAGIAMEYGAEVPFLRSDELSSDNAGSWDVVREVLDRLSEAGEEYETIMLLQPTSPLRTSEDIVRAFDLMDEKNALSVLGVTETEHSPIWCNTIGEDLSMDNFRNEKYADLPRQMLPKFYRMNGAIYLLKREELYKKDMFRKKSYAYIMPREKSIDIDTELDFKVAEIYMKEGLT